MNDFENELKKMRVRSWRKLARDRAAWKLVLKVKALQGSWSQWRRKIQSTEVTYRLFQHQQMHSSVYYIFCYYLLLPVSANGVTLRMALAPKHVGEINSKICNIYKI